MKRLLMNLAVAMVAVGCGKAAGPIPFPESGTVDLQKIPAGTYKLTKITSQTNAASGMQSTFSHSFKKPGDPEKGDQVERTSSWSGVGEGQIGQLTAELNLPLTLVATGTVVDFQDRYYYWHYQRSNDAWQWYIGGSRSEQGRPVHSLFKEANRKNETTYGQDATRVTAKQDGQNVTVYYEFKGTSGQDITQVIELQYVKQ